MNVEHLLFDDRLCHTQQQIIHMQTQYSCQNLGLRIKENKDTFIQSGRFSSQCSEGNWKPPRTTSSDCHPIHTTVNVFPGIVDGEYLEDRQMADEGKVCHLAESIPLIPKCSSDISKFHISSQRGYDLQGNHFAVR